MLFLWFLVKIALNELTFEVIVHLQQHVHVFLQLSIFQHQSVGLLLICCHQFLAPRFLIRRYFRTTLLSSDRSLLYFLLLRVL